VLIHGAAGGVGLMAVQLSRAGRRSWLPPARRGDFLRGPVPFRRLRDGLAERVRAAAPEVGRR
jgi:hypothetical protein